MLKFIFDSSVSYWKAYHSQGSSLYIAGNVFVDNDYNQLDITIESLFKEIKKIESSEDLNFLIKRLTGQYALVYTSLEFTVVVVDKIRSFPIFRYSVNDAEYLSNTTKHFSENMIDKIFDKTNLLCFKMAGYTFSEKTIYKGLNVVKNGSYIYSSKNSFNSLVFFKFFSEEQKEYENISKEIDKVITKSIQRTIAIANGRKIIIPLSAGYDSRLILAKLVEHGYSNILTFTYGPKNIWEKATAEKTAESLGVEWVFVEFDSKTKKMFYSQERKDYYLNASGFYSVPHLADYYALKILIKENKINPYDCIVVNGQSGDFITGAHIPIDEDIIDSDKIYNKIIYKHYALWKDLLTDENIGVIKKEIEAKYSFNSYNEIYLLIKRYEYFENDERQVQYVINGQRAYDELGFGWYLPLWSDEMLDFWSTISLKYKFKQKAYIDYCNTYNPNGIFNIKKNKRANSLGNWALPFLAFIRLLSIGDSKKYSLLKKQYLSFFDKYSPYYPQCSYWEYLKDSQNHRLPVSYWVNEFLNEIKK